MSVRSPLDDRPSSDRCRGFTIIELVISLVVTGIVLLALQMVLSRSFASRTAIMNDIQVRQRASAALEMIIGDVHYAGSGIDVGYATPQCAVAYVDSLELMLCTDLSGGDVSPVDTLAYNPAGNPKPVKLTGAYAPPIKYRTGAELIRWTLDLNNDGVVNAGDLNDANGVDALRTPNPSDYTLVRQIYGDSLNAVANDNGGAMSRIAPILLPGAGVPPLFTVNFKDGTIWNWSSGAVPAAQLKDIASITIRITAGSARADAKGRYSNITLTTRASLERVRL